MWAARIASDDFEHDVHLDSAGDRFGATAQVGARRRISRDIQKCETVIEKWGSSAERVAPATRTGVTRSEGA